ncbi:hypothetical protein FQN60_002434 [Etheostoma spectabile]|uniref:Uncharacterized protein n=1 Tax=Etheostoma spectabile TaxID=54343 RepID=A0A5J5DDX6_9PERO|nr:hypothetical protein FQN60_002434 [Etheostoma spectabile]
MSGGGALQQRTTYLISLTLVKVEAVEENGGEAKNSTQGMEVEAGPGGKGREEAGARVEAEGEAPARAENGAGQQQRAEDAAVVVKSRKLTDELKDGETKPLSPMKDKLPSTADVLSKGSEKPPCNLSIPLPAERAITQKTKSAEIDLTRVEKTPSTPEAKQCRSPSLTTTPPTEVVEPSRTPTRTSLPIRPLGQRPVSLLKSHSNVATRGRDSREGRERSPTSAQSLDRKDCRMPTRSPGPCRASWAEASRPDGWRDLRDETQAGIPLEIGCGMAAVMRENPRKERLKTGSASLPAPAPATHKPSRKGKSRTLDNSDLNSLSEDLGLAREAQQGQRGSAKDRKMLKFISGIFTKSSSGAAGSSSTAPPVYVQRDSSEEEGLSLQQQQQLYSKPSFCHRLKHIILGCICALLAWTLHRFSTRPEHSWVSGCERHITLGAGHLSLAQEGRRHSCVQPDPSTLLKYCQQPGVDPEQIHPRAETGHSGKSKKRQVSAGGRYKKEVLVDGQSHLLLIREEAGPPDAQFSSWVDAVILVFSLENESSFQELYQLYSQLGAQRTDIPVIVVGTQDKISSTNPRVIEDQRARQLCIDVPAQKIVAQKKQAALQACKSLPNSPSHSGGSTPGSASLPGQECNDVRALNTNVFSNGPSCGYAYSLPSTPVIGHRDLRVAQGEGGGSVPSRPLRGIPRRPSLFKNRDSDKKSGDPKGDPSSLRGVPIKQSILWKRSGSSLNKEWKKKYVTLSNNGTLSYHSSSSDYTQNIHGKEIDLLRVTVKVPGKRPPRAVAPAGPSPVPPASAPGVNGLSKEPAAADSTSTVPQLCPATLSVVDDRSGGLSSQGGDRALQRCPSSLSTKAQSVEEENADFIIVSFTGQTWHFEAPSLEDRDAWVSAIESQILASLQSCESGRNKAIRNAKGNSLCVDCEAPNPTWASLNLGALICIECSGIHRNLGTHLSRVRSLDLDDWPGELTQVLAAIGNHMANSIWESCTQGRTKPTPTATREGRESWIRAKYEQRAFVPPLPPAPGPDDGMPTWLLSAVTERDLPRLLLLLAHSTKEQINAQPAGSAASPRSALHAACQLGDYGIDVKARDSQGQTAMKVARKTGSKGCIDILLQHGCPNETSPTTATPVLARRSSTASLGRTSSRKRVS